MFTRRINLFHRLREIQPELDSKQRKVIFGSITRKPARTTLWAILLFSGGVGTVYGEAWQFEPQLSIGAGHDDNWFLNSKTPEAVSAPRVAGDLGIRRLTETIDLKALVRLDYVAYSGVPDERLPDSTNQLYGFSGLFKNFNQTNEFGFDTTYRLDDLNRTVRLSFAPDDVGVDPDPDVDESLVRRTVERDRLFVRPSWKGKVTERLSLGLKYEYYETNYDDGQAVETGLLDFTDQRLIGELSYLLSQRNRLTFSAVGERYEAPPDADRFENGKAQDRKFDSQRLTIGLKHRFTETTRIGFEVGAIRTDFEIRREAGDDEIGVNDGFVAKLTGSQLVGVTRYDARLGRNRYPSGSGDVVQTDEIVGNVSHQFGARTILSLQARLFQNESLLKDNPRTNRRFMSIRPRLRWRMTQWWYLDFLYQYRRQKRDIEEESADSNSVLFSVVYSQPTKIN